jgi:hypothetical protein
VFREEIFAVILEECCFDVSIRFKAAASPGGRRAWGIKDARCLKRATEKWIPGSLAHLKKQHLPRNS